MKTTLISILTKVTTYFFILLFTYASVSKILDFENFQVQIAQSPLLSSYANQVSYGVVILELVIVVLLTVPKFRLTGLYASFGLMCAFTAYIYLILNHSDFVPCSCGGILEKMGWTEHLFFNIACVLVAALSVLSLKQEERKKDKDVRPFLLMQCSLLLGIFIASSLVVISLFFSSEQIIKKENNFTRRFPHQPILQDQVLNLETDSYYFAGANKNGIYLANKTSPFHILRVSNDLSNMERLSVTPEGNHTYKALTYQIRRNDIYGFDGTVPVIYKGLLSTNVQLQTISLGDAYYNQVIARSPVRFALRTNVGSSQKNVLAILDLGSKPELQLQEHILSREKDNWFDSDGRLLYDEQRDELYYMFYHRNQILKMDDQLRLIGQGKTIDTTSDSRIKTRQLTDGSVKMSHAPTMVNYTMAIHNGLIFNRSALIGRSEPKEMWKKASIIDVYKTNSFDYWGSFYVLHRSGRSLSQMLVTDQYLYALVGDHLVRYRPARSLMEEINRGNAEKP